MNNLNKKIAIISLVLLITGIAILSIFFRKDQSLSISVVEKLVSSKGKENITWEDFEKYPHTDVGSGIYIYEYPMKDGYKLYVGGADLDDRPQYIYTIDQSGEKSQIVDRGL